MDFVIMNPPFTRDSLRHDQFPPNVERAIKEREKLVLGRLARRKATRLHGRFLLRRGSFRALERWQTAYLPVYGARAAVVVIAFPPLFDYA